MIIVIQDIEDYPEWKGYFKGSLRIQFLRYKKYQLEYPGA